MADLLPDQLRLMAANFPDEEAFRDVVGGDVMTFAQWESASNRLARWFLAEGVEVGDRIGLLVPPDEAIRFLVAYAAVHKAGAVAVPTGTRLVARELVMVLGHAGASIVVCGAGSAATLAEALPELPDVRTVVTTALLDVFAAGGAVAFEDATDPDDSEIQVPVTSKDMADIMYTSGTTGRPKGVVVRHGNIALMPSGLPRWTRSGWLHASPMFTFAGIASAYNPAKLGLRHLYLPRFDVDQWFDAVDRERPSVVFLVPAMAELLIASPRWADADLSPITLCHVGSAPLAPATFQALRDRLTGALVSNSWGMTEAGPAYCHMPPEEQDRRVGSVGRPMPPVKVRIVGPDGAELAANEVGELQVSNPGREREYFNDPEATARTWKDGWLITGDLAKVDEDGFLYLVGREKDVIIRGGNNVHAGDVEAVLYEHPAVQEAAVAGVAHAVLGEDVGAWVVLVPGASADGEELRAWCAERLSDYKVPRKWTFLESLPRNPTGKVVKRDLPGREVADGAGQDVIASSAPGGSSSSS